MNTVNIGDVFVEQDHREHGRLLKVLAIFSPLTHQLDEGYVACSSKGKVTIMSLARMANESRFKKYAVQVEAFSYGR